MTSSDLEGYSCKKNGLFFGKMRLSTEYALKTRFMTREVFSRT